MKSILRQAEELARRRFRGSRGSHDWEHTQRVVRLADHLALAEGADRRCVRIAALLHDIGRAREDRSAGKIDHAADGAKQAARILKALGLRPVLIGRIVHCIAAHRFRTRVRPMTLEAKVLFDADKLDSIGAVGIGRAFLFAGEIGAKLHNPGIDPAATKPYSAEDTAWREFQVKLRKVRGRILTREGRRLAKARHAYMVRFFRRLDHEVSGTL